MNDQCNTCGKKTNLLGRDIGGGIHPGKACNQGVTVKVERLPLTGKLMQTRYSLYIDGELHCYTFNDYEGRKLQDAAEQIRAGREVNHEPF